MIYILIILSLLLLSTVGLTIGVDLYLYYKSVFYRIHIGRWDNETKWLRGISKVNFKWLIKTPTVKLTDGERYVILDIYRGKYRKQSIQSWQEAGALLGGITYLEKTIANQNQLQTYIDSKINKKLGNWVQIPEYVDGVILAYAIAKHNTKENLEPLFEETINLINRNKGEDGTIFYRDFIPNIRFVDTIGFICPFLTFYGITYQKPQYVKLAYNQIKTYLDNAFLKEVMLPAHAYDINTNIPFGIYGWGRGSGWFILGVVDMFNELPNGHEYKLELKDIILKLAENIIKLQRSDGGFNAVLTIETRHDSSITTLAGWLFLNTFLITKEAKYLDAAKACIKSLMKVTRRNGAIDFCQGDTKGIGVYATTFDVMPFVQGLAIRLYESIKQTEI